MKTFEINENYQILCDWQKTRNGFKHVAKLKNQHFVTIAETKVCYLNRTWESFEYETVIAKLLEMAKIMTKDEQRNYLDLLQKREYDKIRKQFALIGNIAKLGDILCQDKKDKNDWKKRIIKAGLPDMEIPADWDQLTEDEKENRLNNIINELQK